MHMYHISLTAHLVEFLWAIVCGSYAALQRDLTCSDISEEGLTRRCCVRARVRDAAKL